MKFIRRSVRALVAAKYRRDAARGIKGLRASTGAAGNCIADALERSLNGQLTEEEQDFIARIEVRRNELLCSTERIQIDDYGAGQQTNQYLGGQRSTAITRESTVGSVCGSASKSYFWSLFLFNLVRALKPASVVELGSCMGISGAYQAGAQQLNGSTRFVSLEGSLALAAYAKDTLNSLGLRQARIVTGKFDDTLHSVLAGGDVDYAFIDGHHSEEATLRYFGSFLDFCARPSVLVFDDISWSSGMRRAWNLIEAESEVRLSVDLRTMGIVVLGGSTSGASSFRIPLL